MTIRIVDGETPVGQLRRKGTIIVALILLFTLAAVAASAVLAPSLAASSLLAYTFGLRHGVDADHIAAIDNVTRRLTVKGRRPATVGLFFALGHSSVVMLLCIGIMMASDWVREHLSSFERIGGVLGTCISGGLLLTLGCLNLAMSKDLWRAWREGTKCVGHEHGVAGFFSRCCPGLFECIKQPWQMFPVGFIFGLGFDTSSEVGLLGIVAIARGEISRPSIMVLPALFMSGMCLVDTLNGLLMAWAYGRAVDDSMQRLYYNLFLTTTSGAIGVAVGAVELLGVASIVGGLHGAFWDAVAAINDHFEVLGMGVVLAFLLSLVVALTCFARVFPGGRPSEEPATKQPLLLHVDGGDYIDRSCV